MSLELALVPAAATRLRAACKSDTIPTLEGGASRMMSVAGLKRLDSRPIPDGAGEIRAFLVVRNEALRLPATLQHHREIGVDRFFVIDNGSTDGTRDLVNAAPDAHLFATAASFADSNYGLTWTNGLLDEFAADHWALTIDADELFIYPHHETVKLPQFCTYLTRLGAQAVFCLLLDMYGDQTLGAAPYRAGASMLEACPYFDAKGYRAIRVNRAPFIEIYGGVRERVFRDLADQGYLPPTVSKVPLVRWRKWTAVHDRYVHCLAPPVLMSDIQAALPAHFKFLHDFPGTRPRRERNAASISMGRGSTRPTTLFSRRRPRTRS